MTQTQSKYRTTSERRAEIQTRAAEMGIDDEYISCLVETFYNRVKEDKILGPIFAKNISNWDVHLPKMKDFWSSVALHSSRYSGQPVPAHVKLASEVEPRHFTLWLALFKQTLKDTAPSEAAIPYFMERAERIAQSLQLSMFGDPALPELQS
ncbi:MAG: group III truncated hemoglobin [Rhizobiaceae bacterium]|nr:group III truncated hemoglobin [Rhizobiaceae bacterium]MBL4696134.1 group III truncated hemoglobin [Rhizobiaceae bacterium]MBL4733460.1 group III truncated hemoglobin [Rhizobiaceae bacterium]